MKIHHTAFGKTLYVDAEPHNMKDGETPDGVLYVERSEDYYALMSPAYKDKKIAIVTKEAFHREALRQEMGFE